VFEDTFVPQGRAPAEKRIGTMTERSLSVISVGGAGSGAARLIKSSASASRRAEPELLTITTLPSRSTLKARLTTPSTPLARGG
jgi:hypothetical protein